ncbi:CoA-binding protein [Granulosicoccus sp. 3-233]|uniref:CoA-binding protein n=1 Tax=Granulosicoccus sp. 3-233 TaxID=3417969 RepID=UPI003D354004
MNHREAYPEGYIAGILSDVKTMAMVGASPDPSRPSHGVLRVLKDQGYNMIPVNPKQAGEQILGLDVVASLADIDEPVDMVDVFRVSEALPGIAKEAIDIGAGVLWSQLGVYSEEAARLAEEAGLRVVMNRCPKIELFR